MDPRDRQAREDVGYPPDYDSPGNPPEHFAKIAAERNINPNVDQQRAQLAVRIDTCKLCPELNALRMCRQCGCFMPAKVRIKNASCPIGKWYPITPIKFLEPDDS